MSASQGVPNTERGFHVIVFQRQLFGSYPQLARGSWLLELTGPPRRPRPTRFRIRVNVTLTYRRNGTASTTFELPDNHTF
jgi:hypothetical protein